MFNQEGKKMIGKTGNAKWLQESRGLERKMRKRE